ncbi:pseudouridine synthase [Allorhodopirellula heiligendammensis]|uniref:Pseudouridine synthase n=1 Tax=Allorhodopirellula heiligendammensis TaxID=2714739 RepID=A0A5C6C7H7_9BACT|nr:pseudouridine synthase [Allorhodopirellula heiligendammensis]TWU19977.1 Ribosomal large subunit pseudouridine synthase B [Allorhodopirellula heiligendammensis]
MPRQPAPRKQSTRRAKSASPRPQATDAAKRLNQLLASAGLGSRRHCEDLIREGRVDIDGQIVTQLGVTVDPTLQKVRVDGVPLKPQKLVYYAVHKPNGVVSTNSDPQGRPRVVDLVPPTQRVYPVGRLDRTSDGLILLTNDGDLAQSLAHPKFGVQKIYRVTVAGEVRPETMRKMREGIYIAEGLVRVDGAKIIKAKKKATDMEIRLREGKNREIRRILAKFGHKVQTLRRIAIGPLRLGDMPAGAYRNLTRAEIDKLHAIAAQAAAAPPEKPTAEQAAGRGGTDGRGPGVGKPRDLKPAGKKAGKASTRSAKKTGGAADTRTENRRPVKSTRRPTKLPQRDKNRIGTIIVGDEVIAEVPQEKPKSKTKQRSANVKGSRQRTGRGFGKAEKTSKSTGKRKGKR